MAKGKVCVPVVERALLARVNRKLARDGPLRVKKLRGQAQAQLGDYCLLDLNRNTIKVAHLDLESYARDLGVLLPYVALVCE